MAKDNIVPMGLYAPLDSKLKSYNTIEDMKSDRKLKVGQVVNLLGYYKQGDGAGHQRKIENEDDGSGVQLANGLWANIYGSVVKTSWVGIKTNQESTDILNKLIKRNNTQTIIIEVSIRVVAKNPIVDDIRGGLSAIVIPSNKEVKIIGNNNTIELMKNNLYSYGIIETRLNSKLTVENLILKGDASTHDYSGQQYPTHEWGAGITSEDSHPSFLYLKNCKIYDCVGDGVTLNCYDYIIDNCEIVNNGRNNISVISSKFGIIRDTILNEAGKPSSNIGFSPKAGIDLEGETTKIDEINAIIDNCVAKKCAFAGFQASPRRVSKFNIEFNNCISDSNTNQNYISAMSEFKGVGTVVFNNCTSKNGKAGFCFNGLGENGKTIFNNCISINDENVCYSLIKGDVEYVNVNVFGHFKIIGKPKPMSIAGNPDNITAKNCYIDNVKLNFDYLTGLDRYDIYGVFYYPQMKKNGKEYKFKNIVCDVVDKNGIGTIIMDITTDVRLRYNLEQCICNNKHNYVIVTGNHVSNGMRYEIKKDFPVVNNKIYKILNLSNQNIVLNFLTVGNVIITPKQFKEVLILNNGTELSYKILNETVDVVKNLDTPHYARLMSKEGCSDDFDNYLLEKHAYDKQQEQLERDKQLAYEEELKQNPNLTYEEFIQNETEVDRMMLPEFEEPQVPQSVQNFIDKYINGKNVSVVNTDLQKVQRNLRELEKLNNYVDCEDMKTKGVYEDYKRYREEFLKIEQNLSKGVSILYLPPDPTDNLKDYLVKKNIVIK